MPASGLPAPGSARAGLGARERANWSTRAERSLGKCSSIVFNGLILSRLSKHLVVFQAEGWIHLFLPGVRRKKKKKKKALKRLEKTHGLVNAEGCTHWGKCSQSEQTLCWQQLGCRKQRLSGYFTLPLWSSSVY